MKNMSFSSFHPIIFIIFYFTQFHTSNATEAVVIDRNQVPKLLSSLGPGTKFILLQPQRSTWLRTESDDEDDEIETIVLVTKFRKLHWESVAIDSESVKKMAHYSMTKNQEARSGSSKMIEILSARYKGNYIISEWKVALLRREAECNRESNETCPFNPQAPIELCTFGVTDLTLTMALKQADCINWLD